jgi:iron complex outermembrane receptor protein
MFNLKPTLARSMKFLVALIYVLAPLSILGQIDTVPTIPLLSKVGITFTQLPMGVTVRERYNGSVEVISSEDFNAGNITDPLMLLQGRVNGLLISKPGDNVNGRSTARLRSVSSLYLEEGPLLVIDGFPALDRESVDPHDIAEIRVLRDGAATAAWGSRAAGGVIFIKTKSGQSSQKGLSYSGFTSVANVANPPPVAGREDYVNTISRIADLNGRPGNQVAEQYDFGGSTDWIDEVTRTGISTNHHLAYQGSGEKIAYRLSGTYRDVQGIGATNDGFDQFGGRGSITGNLLNNRLFVRADLSARKRNSSVLPSDVFRYAMAYNPTAPVLVTQLGFQLPSDIEDNSGNFFRDYFQLDRFNYHNPVGIMNLFRQRAENSSFNGQVRARLAVTDDFHLRFSYGRNLSEDKFSTLADRKSRYRGFAGRSTLIGAVTQSLNEETNQYFTLGGSYQQKMGKNHLFLNAGYSWQSIQGGGTFASGFGFPDQINIDFNILDQLIPFLASEDQLRQETSNYHHRVIGFNGNAALQLGKALHFNAGLVQEGSSRNGPNHKWNLYPSLAMGADVFRLLGHPSQNDLHFRMSYGIAGRLPNGEYDYLGRFVVDNNQPQGIIDRSYVATTSPQTSNNDELRPERTATINFGLDLSLPLLRLTGSADFYRRTTTDLITPPSDNFLNSSYLLPVRRINASDLMVRNQGVEFSVTLSAPDASTSKIIYEPTLRLATYSSRILTRSGNGAFRYNLEDGPIILSGAATGFVSSCCGSSSRVVAGESIGSLYAAQLDEAASLASGQATLIRNTEDPSGQFLVGQGLPSASLSLVNKITVGRVSIDVLLSGVFGHSLVNYPHALYGNQSNSLGRPFDNVLLTDRTLTDVTGLFETTDYFIEKANYLSLENLRISYNFKLGPASRLNGLQVFLTGQRLVYLTGYSGNDPSVRFFNDDNNDGRLSDQDLNPAPGLDRLDGYWRTRTFGFGVEVAL